MPNSDLLKYISTLKSKNIAETEIKNKLIKAGWAEKEVNEALQPTKISEPDLPPPPVPHFGMWVAFEYIIMFICLYISFTSLAGLMDHAVNQIFPDNLDSTTYYSSSSDDFWLKGFISGIVVAFPIFAALFITLKKQAYQKPIVKNLKVRKVLIYITLVITFLRWNNHNQIYRALAGDIFGCRIGVWLSDS
jgi:hypothetical protein